MLSMALKSPENGTLSISEPDRNFEHLILAFNLTPSRLSKFILTGIPGLEAAHIWISIPFSMFYIISLLGNCMVLFLVSKERTLHKPMYLLLCMLVLTDISQCTCVVPKALSIFWFHFKSITLDGCLTQMFFINAAGAMQGAVLVTMAFDRYIAICDPLRYPIILTNERIALLGLLGLIRSILLVLPLPLLLRRLPFCTNRIIPNTFCEHITVMKMSCADTTANHMYSVVGTLGIIGLDFLLIGLSYGLILKAVLSIRSKKAHSKALHTCTTHICLILTSYSSFLFSALVQRFGQGIPDYVHILFRNLFFLVPPMLHPIIYGVRTKEIRDKMGKYICKMW